MNVIDSFKESMIKNVKNTDLTSDLIVHYYQSASKEEKELINNICMCLTGIQFDTILLRAGIEKPFNKVS